MNKFRKLFSALVFVTALTVVFTSAAAAADLAQVHTTKNGLSFKFPAGWTAMESAADKTIAVVLMDSAAPTFGMTVTVTEDVPAGSLDMTEEQAKEAFSQMGSDFKMIEYKKTKLAGGDAQLIEYSVKVNDLPMQNRQIMGTVGGKGVIVTTAFMDMGTVSGLHPIVEAIEASVALQ